MGRYVGFEPPGGTISKKLQEETSRLGWISCACGHDWITRLSIRAVQNLREKVINELVKCDRSKCQLLCLISASILLGLSARCFKCCASWLERLGGGPLVM